MAASIDRYPTPLRNYNFLPHWHSQVVLLSIRSIHVLKDFIINFVITFLLLHKNRLCYCRITLFETPMVHFRKVLMHCGKNGGLDYASKSTCKTAFLNHKWSIATIFEKVFWTLQAVWTNYIKESTNFCCVNCLNPRKKWRRSREFKFR